MSVRYLPGLDHEKWYVIAINEAEKAGQPWWRYYRAWLHGPTSQASIEWNILGEHSFGVGVQLGRNGDESDLGLSLYGGRLFSLWLRARTPHTKWARISKESDPKGWYHARHTSLRLFPHKGCYLSAEWDNPEGGYGKREWSLTSYKILGRNRSEKLVHAAGTTKIPMPEGVYDATYEEVEYIRSYVRWPGTWIDALRGKRRHRSVSLDVPGGIPVEGKGENSWDCGMDGLFGCGGSSVEDAIANAVRSVLRDRNRYGGPHNLPRAMTVSEAAAA